MNYNTFEFLKKISYERIGGTEKEKQCADEIMAQINKLGVCAHMETFFVDDYKITQAKLEILEPVYQEFTVTGFGMSGSTPLEGIEKEFVYIQNATDVLLKNVEDKIVLLDYQNMPYDVYKKLVDNNVAGFITISGTVYDDINKTDLDQRALRSRHYDSKKIPGVCIRAIDAEKLLLLKPSKARLTLIQEEGKRESRNIVATIEGTKFPDEIVVFTAHYDSVIFSTGAYDNGTGSTTILEIMNHFVANKPLRTLKFIWCGSEEMGLLGSKDYASKHEEELNKYLLCINVDMTGVLLGHDIARCSTDNDAVEIIKILGKKYGFPIEVSQGVYSSDSTPFADKGVPAISFARLPSQGGAVIHSRLDVLDHLAEENYYNTCRFITDVASFVIDSYVFPIDKKIPQTVREQLDKYLGK